MSEHSKNSREEAFSTPLMRQYLEIKRKYQDAILLFRVGDFYETFGEDAVKTATALGIALTRRSNGAAAQVELAGFPYHALDTYLPRLVRAGYRVAICEQLEEPSKAKKLVRRGVTEVVTPGMLVPEAVEVKSNVFLGAVAPPLNEKQQWACAFFDLTTGEFWVAEGSEEELRRLWVGFRPAELLVPRSCASSLPGFVEGSPALSPVDDWVWDVRWAYDTLTNFFKVRSLKGFGLEGRDGMVRAAGAVVWYVKETHHDTAEHISPPTPICVHEYVWLDEFTVRNLELVSALMPGGKSLLEVLDRCATAMGSRLLRKWLLMPLKDPERIRERLESVEWLYQREGVRSGLLGVLRQMGDVERLCGKIALRRATPRDVRHLAKVLGGVQKVKEKLEGAVARLQAIGEGLAALDGLRELIERVVVEEPPAQLGKGDVIAEGVSPQLDEYRRISRQTKELLLQIQQEEAQRTGIASLKVGYNQVFGYYLEVTNAHRHKVPKHWIRKQTLTGAERYITPELKELEEKILSAEEKIEQLERALFEELVAEVLARVGELKRNAELLAELDVYCALAECARAFEYVKPEVDLDKRIEIVEGRHPVVEQMLAASRSFVPNSVELDDHQQQIIILTGPNMAGKSVVLRQTALIVLMAQMGSFVPARQARIGVVDRIFTRVGASDSIATGESTFMVEMHEAATILHNASDRSLILLDEIGRGTSTYDGIAIAWSIVEYLHDHQRGRPLVLFATHYHELCELEKLLPRVKNWTVEVVQQGGEVLFLYRLRRGSANRSFGIEVAQMAGVPLRVCERARQILSFLQESRGKGESLSQRAGAPVAYQLSIFQLRDEKAERLAERLRQIDPSRLTPIEALLILAELKRELEGDDRGTRHDR